MNFTLARVMVARMQNDGLMDRRNARLALCAFLVTLGAAVLMGWLLGIEALKSVAPNLSTMKANTAIGFVLVGTGLAGAGSSKLLNRQLAAGAGVLLTLLGILTIIEYAAK